MLFKIQLVDRGRDPEEKINTWNSQVGLFGNFSDRIGFGYFH
jgi:hypothetical protein